jgi:hypothetical protein
MEGPFFASSSLDPFKQWIMFRHERFSPHALPPIQTLQLNVVQAVLILMTPAA